MWIDFLCIELATDETRKFDTLIRDALKLKGRSRSVELRGSYYRLNEARELKDGSWIGNMLRTRMDRAAYLSRIDGETEDLELDEDQGLGDDTWFLYEPLRRSLLLQRNWSNGCRPDAANIGDYHRNSHLDFEQEQLFDYRASSRNSDRLE